MADESFEELRAFAMFDDYTYPIAAPMLPHLVELCVIADSERAHRLWCTGALADSVYLNADETAAALAPHAGRLVPMLADPDSEVRSAVAYVLRQAGDAYPAAALWERWATEPEPTVRISLLFALVARDPDRAADVARAMLVNGDPDDRVGAALALDRAGLDPGPGAAEALMFALAGGGEVDGHWCWYPDDILTDLIAGVVFSEPLMVACLASPARDVRVSGIDAISRRCEETRSAPAQLLPRLVPLLDDPDDEVRAEAARAFLRGGQSAATYADALARCADGLAHATGDAPAELAAAHALLRLGDPRWVAPMRAAWERDLRFDAVDNAWLFDVPVSGAVLLEVQAHLSAATVAGPAVTLRRLARFLHRVGRAGAGAGPELRAAASLAPAEVAAALVATGAADDIEVEAAARAGDVPAGMDWLHRSGDAGPVMDALRTALAGRANERPVR